MPLNLHIEHDARALARLTGAPEPHFDGIILRHGDMNDVLATTMRGNPLDTESSWLLDIDVQAKMRLAWSGTLSGDGLFSSHPANWMRAGREAFAAFCREVAPQLVRHRQHLCLQPHSRHVLSDVQSCLGLLRDHDGGPFGIALSPATLLEPVMLESIEDHLQRMFESLGALCAMVCLSDVIVAESAAEARCEQAALGEGCLPRQLVRNLVRDWVPSRTPIVISAPGIDRQVEWLTG